MADKQPRISRKREIDPEGMSTNLFSADKQLLDDYVKRAGSTRAAMLREIVHNWATKERYAPGGQDASLITLQKKAMSELNEARQEIQAILRLAKTSAESQGDLFNLTDTEFKRLFALTSTIYNVLAQALTLLWALVDLFQRYAVIPALRRDPQHQADPVGDADREIQDARAEGLQLAEMLGDKFQSPVQVQMDVFSPLGEG
jgi:hypothetical protein